MAARIPKRSDAFTPSDVRQKGDIVRRVMIGLAVVVLLAWTSVSAGGGERGDWEIGPYVGFGFLDDYETLSPDDDFLYGLRVGYFLGSYWSVEGSYQRLSTETQFSPLLMLADRDADIEALRLNLLFNFRPGESLRPFLTLGFGRETTDVDTILDEDDTGLNLGGGARWSLGDTFGLRVDGRYVQTDVGGAVGDDQRNLEVGFGALWMFGGGRAPDRDGDGVIDSRDECPSTPRRAAVDSRGCPSDTDGDGIPDGLDRCLGTPRSVSVDDDGCPLDSDGDGVNDAIDRCTRTPRGALVDAGGCPQDADRDGVFDGIDRCPNTLRGAKVDALGCSPDRDRDGVPDGLDACPDTPWEAEVDARGCSEPPRKEPILFDARSRLILKGVSFQTDSANLTPSSLSVLDEVTGSLEDWPEIRVEVGGHTDSMGESDYNLRLSSARAEAVRDYLVGKGVRASRLTVRGYGENRPVDDNSTREGRSRNRRVELIRID